VSLSDPFALYTQILDQQLANIFKTRVFANDKWESHGKYLPPDSVLAKLAVFFSTSY